GDAAVVELDGPDDIRPRVPFRVDVRVLADRAGEARVRLEGERDVVVDDPERTVTLAAGSTSVAFTVRITEPGTSALHARVTLPGDRHPENDEGVLLVATERDARALCIEGSPGNAASFARALAAERITAEVRPPARLPRELAGGAYDMVVLADVPRTALP